MSANQNHPMRFSADAIPAALQRMNGWTVTGSDKIPHHPTTLGRANPTDPTTGGTFAEALAAVRRHRRFDRLGLIVSSSLVGFDWDDALDADGAIDPDIYAEIEQLGIYVELSPSRTGLRGFAFGALPPGGRKRGNREVYDAARYLSVTGWHVAGPTDIESIDAATLHRWHAAHFAPPASPLRPNPQDAVLIDEDDGGVLRRAERMANFRALFAGDMSVYGDDHSAADLGLLNFFIVAGATNPDQLDRLFRASGLYREKWERRDYRERTIARALDGRVVPFDGWIRPNPASAGPNPQDAVFVPLAPTAAADDGADDLPDDIPTLKEMIRALTRRIEAAEQRAQAAEARADMLAAVQSTTGRIIRNRALGQERMTAVALTYAMANREAAGDRGDGGLYPIPLARIAETAGVSEDAASKHIAKLVDAGVMRKELRWQPESVDPETGELRAAHKRQWIGPAGDSVIDFVERVAALTPEKPKTWGGRLDRCQCPDHPHAGTVKRWTIHCAECGRVLDRGEEFEEAGPNPHLADDQAAETEHIVSVDTTLRGRNDASSHNDEERRQQERRAARTVGAREDLERRERARPTGPRCIQCHVPIPPGSGFYCHEHGGSDVSVAPPLPGFEPPSSDRRTA